MRRSVTAEMDLEIAGSVDLILSVATAQHVPLESEELLFLQGESILTPTEIVDQSGTRLHRLQPDAGLLRVRYSAVVDGAATATRTSDLEVIGYLRPSRYCESDSVFAQARRQFGGLSGEGLLQAVASFVADGVTYTPGLSIGTDSAVTTLMTGQGVCRDYAHLVIALLRAMDVPARYSSCYAPGLAPMDFHAIAEAYLDGTWYAIDATRLADRRSLVRIATGRDAADCAFLSYHGAAVTLDRLFVDARVLEDAVPEEAAGSWSAPSGADDHVSFVSLG